MIQTVDIFKAIVATLTANCVIDSVVSNVDGTFTISTSNTHWISELEVYTIGGFDYKIEEITQNVSLKISPVNGGGIPNVSGFVIPAPLFFNGTLKMAQNEVDNFKDKMELVPFVYLYEVIRDRKNTDEESTIERECDLRFFFINSSSFKDMLTEDIYEKVIYPLHPLVELFIAKLKNSPLFTDVLIYDEINLLNFSEEGNQNKSIFDLNLSAIELRLQAEIRSVNCDDIIVNPNPTCLPARITDGSEVVEVASGSEYTCQSSICSDATYDIKDTDTNVLYSGSIPSGGNLSQEIQNSTVNVKKSDNTLINSVSVLAEGSKDEIIADSVAVLKDTSGNTLSTNNILAASSSDIIAPDGNIEINSVAMSTVESGSTENIEVRKSTGADLIGSKQGLFWRISDSQISVNGTPFASVKATESLNVPVQYVSGIPVGNIVGGVVEVPDPACPTPEVLIPTMINELYSNNFLNTTNTLLGYDTKGLVDLVNTRTSSKPTPAIIGTKISYSAIPNQFLYNSTLNFMKSIPSWMITVVCKFNSAGWNVFLSCLNETNNNTEGVWCVYNTITGRLELTSLNSSGVQVTISNVITLVDGNDYIFTFAWDGTNSKIYLDTTERISVAQANPFSRPTQTDNVSTMAIIRPSVPAGNFYAYGNIGYIGVDEFDLTRLNANVATLKTTFGI